MADQLPLFEVVRPGAQTTVQDLGRQGYRAVGVPYSGALDRFAYQAANALLSNPPTAATLEILLGGLTLRILQATTIAITGADLGATLDDQPLPLWTTYAVAPGQQISFGQHRWGARAYLGIAGGIHIPALLGSHSTYLAGGWGGLAGRALQAGDLLIGSHCDPRPAAWLPPDHRPPYRRLPTLRCLPGPHWASFDPGNRANFTDSLYTVTPASNRMGYRLHGPPLSTSLADLPSLGVLPGVIQVPPDQQPILLLADAQTTGGYPIIAVVITADLPLAAQLLPGDRLSLAWTSPQTAQTALESQTSWLLPPLHTDITGTPI